MVTINEKCTYIIIRNAFDIGPQCATKKADVLRAKVIIDYADHTTSSLAYSVSGLEGMSLVIRARFFRELEVIATICMMPSSISSESNCSDPSGVTFDFGPECRSCVTKEAGVLRTEAVIDYVDGTTSNLAYLVFDW